MWKHILILGLLFIGIAGYVFWDTHRQHNIPQEALGRRTVRQVSSQQANTVVENENTVPREEATKPLSKAQKVKEELLEVLQVGEETALPEETQKLLEILDTPEYTAFLETGHIDNLAAFYDFLASQGFPADKNELLQETQEIFQEHFPGESAAAVEAQMRQKLRNLLSESTDTVHVIFDFFSDEKNNAWGMHYFQTDFDAFASWGIDIIKNYGLPQTDEPPDERFSGDIPTETPKPFPAPSTARPRSEDGNALTENDIDLESDIDRDAAVEAEIGALLEETTPKALKLPTEPPTAASLEKMLRDTLSPQQLNTALQTLNRYGPEEGLRRLKTSDPEIATHLERLIPRKQETD